MLWTRGLGTKITGTISLGDFSGGGPKGVRSIFTVISSHIVFIISSYEVAVPMQPLVEKLDMPEENISTFMCYLEEHDKVKIYTCNGMFIYCLGWLFL